MLEGKPQFNNRPREKWNREVLYSWALEETQAHPVGPCREGKAGGTGKGGTWECAFIRVPGGSALELPGWGWTGQFKPKEWDFGECHGGRIQGAVSHVGLLGATPGAHAS